MFKRTLVLANGDGFVNSIQVAFLNRDTLAAYRALPGGRHRVFQQRI